MKTEANDRNCLTKLY